MPSRRKGMGARSFREILGPMMARAIAPPRVADGNRPPPPKGHATARPSGMLQGDGQNQQCAALPGDYAL
jgi:hypothetical protein